MRYLLTICFFLLITACVYRPEAQITDENLSTEEIPSKADTTIITYQEGDNTIEEQRVKGFVHSIKVIPKNGKPYYLINADGDSSTLRNNSPKQKIPSWTLFSW